MAVLVALLLLIRLRAMRVTNDTMKVELTSRAPIATLLGASISGLPSIRAYAQSQYFFELFVRHTQLNGRALFTFFNLTRSLGFYLEMLSVSVSTIILFTAFLLRTPALAPQMALVIQLLADIATKFQFGTRLSSEL